MGLDTTTILSASNGAIYRVYSRACSSFTALLHAVLRRRQTQSQPGERPHFVSSHSLVALRFIALIFQRPDSTHTVLYFSYNVHCRALPQTGLSTFSCLSVLPVGTPARPSSSHSPLRQRPRLLCCLLDDHGKSVG